jgi:hypothetical protein
MRGHQGGIGNSSRIWPRYRRNPTNVVAAWVDGAMPFRAETIRRYL